MDGEATVVIKNIGVSAGAILSVHDHVGPNIISDSFIDSKRVERPRFAICDVGGSWFYLLSGLMANAETSVIIGNVLIPIIATLSELFLKSVTFVDQNWLEMSRTVHITFPVALL